MKISYIFSRNEKLGSKLISWASGLLIDDLEKVPSHVAILIELDEIQESLVIESVLDSGVRIIPYSVWLTHNELCYKIPCKDQVSTLDEVLLELKDIWGKKYDWKGILYFGWCFILNLTVDRPFPKENKWQSEDRYFCTEAAARLSGYGKHSMTTPAKMCSDFLKLHN